MNRQGVDIQWQDQISMPHYEGKVCWLFWKVETYEPFSDSVCWGCNPKQDAINKVKTQIINVKLKLFALIGA